MDHRARDDRADSADTRLRAPDGLSRNTAAAVRDALEGRRRGVALLLPLAGPAVVISVAYIDPGNIATNIQAGARYGYALLWVVLLANVIAMLFQGLSAKLGIATGRNLAELCRDSLPAPLVWLMWIVSEIAAMATDLAEFLGGAIGLALLFHLPLLAGMAVTAVVTYALLFLQRAGFRPLELLIGALVGVIGICYVLELFIAPIAWPSLLRQLAMPRLPDTQAVTIAVGIIGATVMPHALFLHSGLTQARVLARNDAERKRLVKFSNVEVVVALSVAGLINMAMVVMASGAFHQGYADVAEIETAYRTLAPLLGAAAASIFLVSLIASGISSSVVGTLAGQMIMQGFVNFRIPLWLRRAVTMVPSFIVVALGVNATEALVMSQVVLSLALPFPMAALVWLTCRRDLMGPHRNRALTATGAVAGAVAVLALNVALVLATFGVAVPGLG
ncbi:Nramp family divalent metal transporter [Paraburkholderia acidiphila]|uniref:Divalent metal cation transporter MntH n=1 Tax=Paraburkholderia acidiphila TaxID=2571747 RepID=A0A7Z2G9J7_9BURK|nr:Nramp family divalent metal transporter [Paraburkholderia acidiphila]QGZ57304.1 Mn(2+) uptake NRAMP transporter MntH [Paraburkholderia acidiphila]